MRENTSGPRVALLVHACDRYELLYEGFGILFNQFMDKNINTRNYFATENREVSIDSFFNIFSGKGAWSDRLARILRDKIKEYYVLYMQEDMWLSKPVDGTVLNEIFDYAIGNNIDCLKLHSSEVYKTKPTGAFIGGLNIAELINEESGFLMSHQITLWKKSFLLEQLKTNEHPWRNERRGTKRLRKLNPQIYQVDLFAENGKPAINTNITNSTRSAYHTVSVNGAVGDNITGFYQHISASNPEYLGRLKCHYDLRLTHDGKPKPKKEGLLTRIKKIFGFRRKEEIHRTPEFRPTL